MKRPWIVVAAAVGALGVLAACQSLSNAPPRPPLALAPQVDIARFMGDWYVIASIPTVFEKGAHNAKESYRLEPDGRIATTFRYEAGDFGGAEKTMHSTGIVLGGNGAIWGQQYIWPIQADYRIAYVSDDYGLTVIAREKRDYVWIMARRPSITQADYQRLAALVGTLGYDINALQRVPQKW